MKTIILILLLLLAFNAPAQYLITNINIGLDYNSNAWSKVNQNNSAFVGWLNTEDASITALQTEFANLNWRMTTNVAALSALSPTNGVATASFVLLTPQTITSSTNPTFGHGAGVLCADTNYLYLSIGTNHWQRLAWGTNGW